MSYVSFIFRYPHSSPSIIFDVYSGPSWLSVWRNCLVGVSRNIFSPPFEVIITKEKRYGMKEESEQLRDLEKRVEKLESMREPIIRAPSDIIWFLLLLFTFLQNRI